MDLGCSENKIVEIFTHISYDVALDWVRFLRDLAEIWINWNYCYLLLFWET